MGLVGGVLVTKRSASDVWSYPSVHGDVMATTDAAGLKQGLTHTYDPFGQAVTIPDNSAGNLDYGWLVPTSGPSNTPGRSPPSRWAPAPTCPASAGS